MKISDQQYATALFEALRQVHDKDHDKVIANFIEALKANRDLGRYERIIEAYEKLELESRGAAKAHVTTAKDVSMNKDLMQTLNDIAGKKLEVSHKTDESLIGGMVMRVDDMLLDASVKTQLSKLKSQLSK